MGDDSWPVLTRDDAMRAAKVAQFMDNAEDLSRPEPERESFARHAIRLGAKYRYAHLITRPGGVRPLRGSR